MKGLTRFLTIFLNEQLFLLRDIVEQTMKMYKCLFSILCCLTFVECNLFKDIIFTAAKVAFDLYGFIFEDDPSIDQELLLRQVADKIAQSNDILKWDILHTMQLNKIEETRLEIHSALNDLNIWINNVQSERTHHVKDKNGTIEITSPRERNNDVNGEIFKKRALSAVPRIRYLPRHIGEHIPGTDKNVIELFVQKTRCNMTAFYAFKHSMLELIETGIVVEFTSLRLEGKRNMHEEKKYWRREMKPLIDWFDALEDDCRQKRRTLALEDLGATNDVGTIREMTKERYLWNWTDVIIASNDIPDKSFYYSVNPHKTLFHKNSQGARKFLIYNDGEHTPNMENAWRTIIDSINEVGWIDESGNAVNIGKHLRHVLNRNYIKYKALIVYFVGDRFTPTVQIDQGK